MNVDALGIILFTNDRWPAFLDRSINPNRVARLHCLDRLSLHASGFEMLQLISWQKPLKSLPSRRHTFCNEYR